MLQIIGWMIFCIGVPVLVATMSGNDKDGQPRKWTMITALFGIVGLVYCFFALGEQASGIQNIANSVR